MNLQPLLNPKSIAIIGASSNQKKIGFQVMNNLINSGFQGEIFPINLKGGTILTKQVYQNIEAVPVNIDLAVIIVPSPVVKEVVLGCASKNVPAIVIISSGFAETGEAGKNLQTEIAQICKEKNIILLGPNCLGVINTKIKLNATFASSMPSEGNIGLISQSGAIVSSLVDWSNITGFGFSSVISLGNKALIDEADILEFLYNDPNTAVISAYIEDITATTRLTEVFKKYTKTKPTIFLVGGQSPIGSKAAKSHTGSIMTSYISIKTYLEQSGVIVAANLSEFFNSLKLCSSYQSVDSALAVITNAGGIGILATDSLSHVGLSLTKDPELTNALREKFRPETSVLNPIDILGDATVSDYKTAIEMAFLSPKVSGVIVIVTPQTSTDVNGIAQMMTVLKKDKPILACFLGGKMMSEGIALLEKSRIPCFETPDQAAIALKELYMFKSSQVLIEPFVLGIKTYNETQKNQLLVEYSIPFLEYYKVGSEEELRAAIVKIGFPVVIKVADETGHKTDSGGVKLNLYSEESALAAAKEISFPVVIGRMLRGQHELFLGLKKDNAVGVTVVFGTGGIYGQDYNDFSYSTAPISTEIAKSMITKTIIGKILLNPKGEAAYDLDLLAQIIVNAAKLISDHTNITEIDFNPIFATAGKYCAVDVRIIT